MQCPFCEQEHPEGTDRCPTTLEKLPRPTRPPPLARMALRIDDERVIELPVGTTVTLGRREPSPIAHVCTDNVSRAHAEVVVRAPEDVVLLDVGSVNGTFVNDQRLPPPGERKLAPGDVVELANDPAFRIDVVPWPSTAEPDG